MKTKTIISLSLFLLAAWSGLCLARSDTKIYQNDRCACWADAGTLEQIDGSIYEIWLQLEFTDESTPLTTIIERVDMGGPLLQPPAGIRLGRLQASGYPHGRHRQMVRHPARLRRRCFVRLHVRELAPPGENIKRGCRT